MARSDLSPEREGRVLRIFVSYRRADTGGHAGRLYDALAARFGRDNVFMDIDTIELGVDFTSTITRAVASYDVVIALIGRGWLDAADRDGRRRLDDPKDFLRLELETALARDVFVIPTLVEGADMPPADRLPESLAPLPVRQGIELRDVAWHDDVERLIRRINRLGGQPEQPVPPVRKPSPAARVSRRTWIAVAAALGAVVAGATVVALLRSGSDGDRRVTAAENLLLGYVPEVVRTTCVPISWGDPNARASVECSAVRVTAYYHLYPSDDVMNARYAQKLEEVGVEPGSGDCTAASFRGDGPFEVEGEPAGRQLCYLDEDSPAIVSTDLRTSVGMEAFTIEGTGPTAAASLLRQWRCCLRTQAR
jgi:hypothetical protein